jgi:hypothetical protein
MMNTKNTLSLVALIAVVSGAALFGELPAVVAKKDVMHVVGALAALETLLEEEVQEAKELVEQDGAAEQEVAVEEVEAIAIEQVNVIEEIDPIIEVVVVQ